MHAALLDGLDPSPVLQNCSGKHAAMLATAVVNGWPTAGYVAPTTRCSGSSSTISRALPAPSSTSGSTGAARRHRSSRCSAWPRAVRQLAVEGHAVHRAMTAYPEMVGGPRATCRS